MTYVKSDKYLEAPNIYHYHAIVSNFLNDFINHIQIPDSLIKILEFHATIFTIS